MRRRALESRILLWLSRRYLTLIFYHLALSHFLISILHFHAPEMHLHFYPLEKHFAVDSCIFTIQLFHTLAPSSLFDLRFNPLKMHFHISATFFLYLRLLIISYFWRLLHILTPCFSTPGLRNKKIFLLMRTTI